jgi:hypothetical protein
MANTQIKVPLFAAAEVLTAAQMNAVQSNDFNQTVSTKTASYTLVAADKGTRIVMNAAGATTITVNTSLFSVGDTLVLQNIGAGVTTVTAGTATVSSAGSLAIPQYGSGILYFTSAGVSIFYPSAVTAAPATSGLTFITSGSFSAVSQGTVTNCFSSAYDNYRVILNCTVWGGDNYLIFGTGGTPSTASNTDWSNINCNNGSVAGVVGNNQNKALISRNYTEGTVQLEIVGANLAGFTKVTGVYGGSYVPTPVGINGNNAALVKNSTQFTDFTIRTDAHPSGSDSWSYKVYGYQNS